MSLTVVIRKDDPGSTSDADLRLTFDAPRVVIGRGASCDVRLPDPSVSQRHATLQSRGAEWTLLDEGSTNGTWASGARLAPRAPRTVRSGDVIRIGRVWIEIRLDAAPPTADLPAATRDLALALVAQAMRAMGDTSCATLTVVEGPDRGARLPLSDEGRVYRIGRGQECDLPLADPDASRAHVQVVRRGATVLVRDAGSKNGATLGEQRVPSARDVVFRPTTALRVGAHVIALEEPVSGALAELEAMPDERVDEAELAPPPPPAPERAAPHDRVAPSAPAPAPRRATSTGAKLSNADVGVVVAAVAVIALSVVGLVWLLRS